MVSSLEASEPGATASVSGTARDAGSPATAAARGARGPGFDRIFAAAERKLRDVSAQMVSSALLLPLLNRMQEDPFRSDLLHGGMAEDSFRSMLNTRLADSMARTSGFTLTDHMSQPLTRWLSAQPETTVQRVARMRIDTLG